MSFNIMDLFPKLSFFGPAENQNAQMAPSYEMNILHGGYVYCVLPMKYDLATDKVRDNKIPIRDQFVVKVGMSSYEKIEDRLKRYGPGTVVLAKIFCMNHGTMEKIILAEFRNHFSTFVGAEYFLARPDQALNLFLKVYAANVAGAVGNIKIPPTHGIKPQKKTLPKRRPTIVVPKNHSRFVSNKSSNGHQQEIKLPDSPVNCENLVNSKPSDAETLNVLVGLIEQESTKPQSFLSRSREFLEQFIWPAEVKQQPVHVVEPLVESSEFGLQPLRVASINNANAGASSNTGVNAKTLLLYSPPHTKVPCEYFRNANAAALSSNASEEK